MGVVGVVEGTPRRLVFLLQLVQCFRVAVVLPPVDGLLDRVQFRPPVAVFQKLVLVCVVKYKRVPPFPPDHAEGHLFECRRVAALQGGLHVVHLLLADRNISPEQGIHSHIDFHLFAGCHVGTELPADVQIGLPLFRLGVCDNRSRDAHRQQGNTLDCFHNFNIFRENVRLL